MSLTARIDAALRSVRNLRTAQDLVTGGQVRDIATTPEGRVRFTFLLDAGDDATLVRTARQVVAALDGVTDVLVDVKDAAEFRAQRTRDAGGGPRRALPVVGDRPQSAQAAVPAQKPVAMPHLGRVIAVSSGKGGVGKSTVSTNLALALAGLGLRVGLMDADIYGPNLPQMLGAPDPPAVRGERIIPPTPHGVKAISLGMLIARDQPAIWRGPIVMKIVNQFLRDVEWGELDTLLVDLPPGTGDAQLSLVQATRVAGAVIVTTPQSVATGDALRGAKMFQRVGVPVLGVVENMSWFEGPETGGQRIYLFGRGGGERLAAELAVPLLGQIPLHPPVLEGGETGRPIVVADPGCAAARAFVALAERVRDAVAAPAGAA